MTDHDQPEDLRKATWGTGNAGQYEGMNSSGVKNTSSKYDQKWLEKQKAKNEARESTVDTATQEGKVARAQEPIYQVQSREVSEARATKTPEEAKRVENEWRDRIETHEAGKKEAAEKERREGINAKADAEAKARAGVSQVDPFANSDYVAPTEEEVAQHKKEQQERFGREEYQARVDSEDANVRLQTKEGFANERNDLAWEHAQKVGSALAQTAAEMGGQMVNRGWDLAGNIVKMAFTQPHAISSTSRMIGTALGSLETAGDFADRAAQKYGIDLQNDHRLMQDTIRYRLYRREAQQANSVVGNTFRAISDSLNRLGVDDMSQLTPEQLQVHVDDMRREAQRLNTLMRTDMNAPRGDKLGGTDRGLVIGQARHIQSYLDRLSEQGATMAKDQRAEARAFKEQSRRRRMQAQQTLGNGQPNPYQQVLSWADPNANWEIDPNTGAPTNVGSYQAMLRTLRERRMQETKANGGTLDEDRARWYNDMDRDLTGKMDDIKVETRQAPLRKYGPVFVGISDIAPGIGKQIPQILNRGAWSSDMPTRQMRSYLSDLVSKLRAGPEKDHATRLLMSLDMFTKTRALNSKIGSIGVRNARDAMATHAARNDEFSGVMLDENEAIKDNAALSKAYEAFNGRLPKEYNKAAFDMNNPDLIEALRAYENEMAHYMDKWFPRRDRSHDKDISDVEDDQDTTENQTILVPEEEPTEEKPVEKVKKPTATGDKKAFQRDFRRIFTNKDYLDDMNQPVSAMSEDERRKAIADLLGQDLWKTNEFGRFEDVNDLVTAMNALGGHYGDSIGKTDWGNLKKRVYPNPNKDARARLSSQNVDVVRNALGKEGFSFDDKGRFLSQDDYDRALTLITGKNIGKKKTEQLLNGMKPVVIERLAEENPQESFNRLAGNVEQVDQNEVEMRKLRRTAKNLIREWRYNKPGVREAISKNPGLLKKLGLYIDGDRLVKGKPAENPIEERKPEEIDEFIPPENPKFEERSPEWYKAQLENIKSIEELDRLESEIKGDPNVDPMTKYLLLSKDVEQTRKQMTG